MRGKLAALGAGVLVAVVALGAASGGFPSRPRVQALTATGAATNGATGSVQLESTVPLMSFYDSDSAVNNRRWTFYANGDQFRAHAYSDDGSTAVEWLTIDRTGVATVDSINLQATAVQVNGTAIPTATGSTSGHTCNGFSGGLTCNVRWSAVGGLACVSWNVSGTSNATTFSITGLTYPAPGAAYQGSGIVRVVDSGTSAAGLVNIATAGTMTFQATLAGGSFTASGTKGSAGNLCYSYQ